MDITLVVSSVLDDASKVTISDTTVYTTPARSDFHSVFYAFKVSELEAETSLVITSQGVITSASSWEVATPNDGYHRFKLILYPLWVAGAYTTGQIVSENGVLYIALTDNSTEPEVTVGTDWAVHTSTSDDDADNLEIGLLNCILFFRLKTCFAKEVAKSASIMCECSVDKKPVDIQKYERLAVLLDGIAVDSYQTRFIEGEKKVKYMSTLCPNCN